MKILRNSILLSIALICFAAMSVSAQETMTNDEVISLTKAGLSSGVIVSKIRSSKSDFDLSTDALIRLKQAGVGDDIVSAMLEAKSGKTAAAPGLVSPGSGDPNDPMSKHSYGIYLYEEANGQRKMTQLQPNVSAQNRTGGKFTNSITPFGLGKIKKKANLPGRSANLQIQSTQPVFYFYLDASSGGLNTTSGIPSTPNEFTLVRFNQRSDNREVTISKENNWGGKGGLSDEYVVEFDAQDMGNGVFKITPKTPLKKGEYGFYLVTSGTSNAGDAIGTKFFDFGVTMTP